MNVECLLILGVATWAVAGLKCYVCKSDFDSGDEYEKEIKRIPYCGNDPYVGIQEHVVVCDVYYDNDAMVNPTFREAMSSTMTNPDTQGTGERAGYDILEDEIPMTKSDTQGTSKRFTNDIQEDDPAQVKNATSDVMVLTNRTQSIRETGNSLENVYPYNLTGVPWGSQRIHPRAIPYYCLTIKTVKSSFPNRVCGLRHFLDCPLLLELTSEPLKSSSFITNCYQCNTDYCNGALGTFLGMQALFCLTAIHYFYLEF